MAINGPSTELQRMAAMAGLTYWDEASGLALHPKYGSWFALRAVLVFEGIEHTGRRPLPRDVSMRLHTIGKTCPFPACRLDLPRETAELGRNHELG